MRKDNLRNELMERLKVSGAIRSSNLSARRRDPLINTGKSCHPGAPEHAHQPLDRVGFLLALVAPIIGDRVGIRTGLDHRIPGFNAGR